MHRIYYQSYCTVLYEHRLYSFIWPISSGDKYKSINLRYILVHSISSCGVGFIYVNNPVNTIAIDQVP